MPAKLWRITAAIASWQKINAQQTVPARRRAQATGTVRVSQPRVSDTAIAMSEQAKSWARQAWSIAKSRPRLVSTISMCSRSKRTRSPPTTACVRTSATAKRASLRSHARSSVRQSHAARMTVTALITLALRRWECSANLSISVSQPAGLTEPLESGQSRKAMPAPMLVVKAPSATSTKTHALPR